MSAPLPLRFVNSCHYTPISQTKYDCDFMSALLSLPFLIIFRLFVCPLPTPFHLSNIPPSHTLSKTAAVYLSFSHSLSSTPVQYIPISSINYDWAVCLPFSHSLSLLGFGYVPVLLPLPYLKLLFNIPLSPPLTMTAGMCLPFSHSLS